VHGQSSRTLLFLMGALTIHLLLCAVFAGTVGRQHDVRKMDARWLAGPRPVQVMIAGDSHARFAVEAPVLGRAVNIAVPGEHYQKTTYRVPWLLDHGTRKVEAVLLPFDAVTFASFKDDSFSPELVWGRYVDFLELGLRKRQPFRYAGRWAKARLAPYVGEMEVMLQFLLRSKHFRDPEGEGSALQLTVFESGERAAHRHLFGADPWDPDMEWAFRRLLFELGSRGLRVVLVRYPVTEDYARESRALGADPALRDRLLAEIARPGSVEHLDYEALFFGRPGMFADGDHLSQAGKRKFSEILASDLRALGILR
jgi:hypothetical protein